MKRTKRTVIILAALAMAATCTVLPLTASNAGDGTLGMVVQASTVELGFTPTPAIMNSIAGKSIGEDVQAEIDAGKEQIEVAISYWVMSEKPILAEVKERGLEYAASLDPSAYTQAERNVMIGNYKAQIQAELYAAAINVYYQWMCDTLGISMDDVEFDEGAGKMLCTLTPEQIRTALETEWLRGKIILRSTYEEIMERSRAIAQPTVQPSVTPYTRALGDLTGDHLVDIMDVICINKALLGGIALTPEQNAAADVDGDGDVTTTDALTILKAVVKLIPDLGPVS